MFTKRATKPERIDIGDYTPEEYARFLREIRFIDQRLGDRSALEKTLLADVERLDLKEFSVLDVGAGTGELLGVIAEFARSGRRKAVLAGLDLNTLSVHEIAAESRRYDEILPIRGDALRLPFVDNAFDYAICSLFTHHLTDEQVPKVLTEMSRVARRGIVVIDLERSVKAWFLYQLFCFAYRISPLVRQDGSLSVRKGFRVDEFNELAAKLGFEDVSVTRSDPFRVVLSGAKRNGGVAPF
ncbi:MAG: methyltransferase domain-containing protein [Acidobacteria bacterium]|nr:methyltransferase domain-containing protein [Acidobacteriota bacterium]